MFKILVQAPFHHIFRTKDIWLTAHEYYHLNEEKDKGEIKYILSDSFPYSQYIYFNKANLSKALLDEVSAEKGLTSFGTPDLLEPKSQYETYNFTDHNTVTTPLGEAVNNPFAQAEESYKFKTPSSSSSSSPIATPETETESKEVEIESVVEIKLSVKEDKLNSRKTRQEELEGLHWKKLKDIAAGYGIEYKDKESAKEEILKLEFK